MRGIVMVLCGLKRRKNKGFKMKKENRTLKQHQSERTKCLVYTRVMGYHRPVESFNIGKKGEHNERKFFTS